jgi:predicted transport protein
LSLEEVFRKDSKISNEPYKEHGTKNPVMVEAGKKAAQTRKNGVYSVDRHYDKLVKDLKPLLDEIRDYIVELDSSIEEVPKQDYIAYKTSQNFVCVEARKNKLLLFLKLNPDELKPSDIWRDVRKIGHFGTGDVEVTITNQNDFEQTKHFIKDSLKNIGG